MRALSAALFACLLATPSPGLAQDDPSATRGVFAPGQSAAAPGQSADAPGQSAGVSPLQPTAPTAPSVSVTGAATPSAGYRRGDPSAARGVYATGQSAGVSPLQPTAPGVSVRGAATPSPGSPQDDSATRGVYAPGEPAGVSPPQPGVPAGLVPADATPSAGFAQDDANSARGVYAPGQSARVSPRAPTVILHGYSTVAIPDYPGVSIPGPATPGQAIPRVVTPTPIPGEPGLGSAVVNGRHAIVEQGTIASSGLSTDDLPELRPGRFEPGAAARVAHTYSAAIRPVVVLAPRSGSSR
jgi:hypothetical protein